jgi:hypothetical protein
VHAHISRSNESPLPRNTHLVFVLDRMYKAGVTFGGGGRGAAACKLAWGGEHGGARSGVRTGQGEAPHEAELRVLVQLKEQAMGYRTLS